jgi:hypothetical protein
VLTCSEDAQRRYQQGEVFVKSCADNLEDFEFGSSNNYLLACMALLGLLRLGRQRSWVK